MMAPDEAVVGIPETYPRWLRVEDADFLNLFGHRRLFSKGCFLLKKFRPTFNIDLKVSSG